MQSVKTWITQIYFFLTPQQMWLFRYETRYKLKKKKSWGENQKAINGSEPDSFKRFKKH